MKSLIDKFSMEYWHELSRGQKVLTVIVALGASLIAWPLMMAGIYAGVVRKTLHSQQARTWLMILMLIPAVGVEGYWLYSGWHLMDGSSSSAGSTEAATDLPQPTSQPQVAGVSTQGPTVTVLQVATGDSFDADINGQAQRVKLLGDTAPNVAANGAPAECYGPEATVFLDGLLRGKPVILKTDELSGDKDANGRLLRYATLPDGTDVNLLLLQSGLARLDTKAVFDKQMTYANAVDDAKTGHKGLWLACDPATKPSPTPTPSSSPVTSPTPSPLPTVSAVTPVNPTPSPSDGLTTNP